MDRATVEKKYGPATNGRIDGPGKFEGQPLYVAYLYELSLDGGADTETEYRDGYWMQFNLTPSDTSEWPELEGRDSVRAYESSDGFFYEVSWEPEE